MPALMHCSEAKGDDGKVWYITGHGHFINVFFFPPFP